ncbi:25995_t:CDS:2 [Gigaspora margarita]|uniref:25995_t:CDS:1 n=1 Tax=Gigaspora margarita TaxID=4874 RepID=A0ABN7VWS2_GIGMA|nr:25995_t:CDS:2 [Gigaspora margarita]
MNLIPLQISTDNNDNTQRHCKGCQKDRPCSLFISNNQNYRTCNILYDHIMEFIEPFKGEKTVKDQENQKSLKFEFSCTVNISMLEGDSKERANYIIEVISDADEYKWIYHLKCNIKKSNSITYTYYCSQRDCLAEKPKKHNEVNKHRDRQSIEHFSCKGQIAITISQDLTFTNIEMYHYTHSPRSDNSISLEIKQYILENIDLLPCEIFRCLAMQNLNIIIHQKQIHFWWTELGRKRYKRDDNSFFLAKKWLIENSHQIIIQKESPQAIGFLSEIWNMINCSGIQINEIGIDSIYNTYNLKFELYVVHVQIDGSGYLLAYLFLENNGNCNNGIRTDFSQISAARFVWKNIKVQLCLWHIKRAIKNRLSNNTKPKQINYNSQMAHNQFHFIDPEFRPQLNIANYVFCPKQFCSAIWEMMNRHLHQHPLIPTNTGQYLISQQIWTMAVQEVYNFCQQHLLTYLSTLENIEDDFLYKFFRPRLDLVVFTIITQIVSQQQRKLQQILSGIEKGDWLHHYHQYPFLGTSSTQTISYNTMNSEIIENIEFIENAEVTENSEDMQVSEEMCIRLINSTKKALEILEDQQNKKILDG